MSVGTFGEKYKCVRCQENPNNKKVWGCEKRTLMATPTIEEKYGNKIYKYWRCPLLYIPVNVALFVKEYQYIKQFPNTMIIPYNKVNDIWFEAVSYFESMQSDGLEMRRKNG